MKTQRRAWMLRAGVTLVALLGGMLGATAAGAAPATPGQPAAPAPAAGDVDVRILAISPDELRSGESATVTFTASHGILGGAGSASVEVGDGLSCTSGCEVTSSVGRLFSARITAGTLGNGERRRVPVAVVSESDRDTRVVTVRGPTGPQTARRVSGRVVDVATGAGIDGAQVGLQDSRGNARLARADRGGRFSFEGSEGSAITPGPVRILAQADDYAQAAATITVRNNETFSVRLRLRSTARPSPTPSPTATAAPTDDAVPPAGEDTPPLENPQPASGEDSVGPLTWIGVALGLLVLAGSLGAGWLLLVRRRQEDAAAKPPAVPGQPAYPRLDDATAIVPQPLVPATNADPLANAPTVVQPAVRDEYADPYGLPPQVPGQPPYPPQQSRHSGPAAWSTPPNYGDATQVGGFAPVGDGAFAQGFPPGATDPGPGALPTNPAYHGAGTTAYHAPATPHAHVFGDPGAPTANAGFGESGAAAAGAGLDTTVGGTPVGSASGADGRADAGPATGPAGHLGSTQDYPGGPTPAISPFGGTADGGFGALPQRPAPAAGTSLFGAAPTGGQAGLGAASADLRTPTYPTGSFPRPGPENGYPPPAGAYSSPAPEPYAPPAAESYAAPAGESYAAPAAEPRGSDAPLDPPPRPVDGYAVGGGERRQLRHPEPQGYSGPSPSPYFPAGAPAPTGETPRYDEPTGHFRPAGGHPGPLTPESYLSGLSQQPGDGPPPQSDRGARRTVEWMDD